MNYIDLNNVKTISRGDDARMLKYLNQFNILIPERIVQLQKALEEQDRLKIRQILHQMSPQIQFFGLLRVSSQIQRLELKYASITFEDLNTQVNQIITILKKSLAEVSQSIDTIVINQANDKPDSMSNY